MNQSAIQSIGQRMAVYTCDNIVIFPLFSPPCVGQSILENIKGNREIEVEEKTDRQTNKQLHAYLSCLFLRIELPFYISNSHKERGIEIILSLH